MTWEELVEIVEETIDRNLDVFDIDNDYSCFGLELADCKLIFTRNGCIYALFDLGKRNKGEIEIGTCVAYSQMYQIINALKQEIHR